MKAWLIPIAVSLAAIGAAGCGDSTSGKLSSSELIKQADAVCKDVNTKTQQLPTPTDINSAASTIGKTVAILIPAQQKLESLEPPGDRKAAYEAWVAKTGEVVDTAKQAEVSAKKGDAKALQENLQQGVELNKQTNSLAGKVGLKVCSAARQ